jgi:hypothetical protein
MVASSRPTRFREGLVAEVRNSAEWPYGFWVLPLAVLCAMCAAAIVSYPASLMNDDPCAEMRGTWRYYENGVAVCVDPDGRVIL